MQEGWICPRCHAVRCGAPWAARCTCQPTTSDGSGGSPAHHPQPGATADNPYDLNAVATWLRKYQIQQRARRRAEEPGR